MTHWEAATWREGGIGSRNRFNTFTCQSTPEQLATHSVRALESTVAQPSHNRRSARRQRGDACRQHTGTNGQSRVSARDTGNTDGWRQRWASLIVQHKKRHFRGAFIVWRERKDILFVPGGETLQWKLIKEKKEKKNSLKTEGENLFLWTWTSIHFLTIWPEQWRNTKLKV